MRKRKTALLSLALAVCCLPVFPLVKTKGTAEGFACAECVMELHSRRVLYERAGRQALPMASTTKILTAITVLEHTNDLFGEYEAASESIGVEGSSAYLKSGERYSTNDLLYGLLLRSGNDCAVALAIRTSGSLEEFSKLLNLTAQAAGALDSRFLTPHGLPCDGHYTTARDLSLITCYALRDERFAQIVSTKFYAPRGWKNKNKMLQTFEGAIGVKTGYTKQAGKCLVSAAKRGNMTLVCTVLNCPNTYARSTELLEDAFATFDNRKILSCDTPVEVEVSGKKVAAHVQKDLFYPLREEEYGLLEREVVANERIKKFPKKGDFIGQIKISLANRLLFSEKLYKL